MEIVDSPELATYFLKVLWRYSFFYFFGRSCVVCFILGSLNDFFWIVELKIVGSAELETCCWTVTMEAQYFLIFL